MQILLEHQRTFENKQFVFCWLGNKRQGREEAITPCKACVVNTHCHGFLGFLECLSLQQMFCWEIHVREISCHGGGYRVKLLYRLSRQILGSWVCNWRHLLPPHRFLFSSLNKFFPLVLFLLCSPWDFLFLQKNAFCKSDWLPQRLLLTQYQLTQTTWVSGSGVRCPHFPHRAFYLPILNQNLDPHPFFCYGLVGTWFQFRAPVNKLWRTDINMAGT